MLNLKAPFASSLLRPIARSTCEGAIEPAAHAEPLDAHIPFISSIISKDTHTIINMRNYIVDRILGEIPDVTFDGPCIDANDDVNAVSAGLPMCSLKRLPSNMHFCFKDVSGD